MSNILKNEDEIIVLRDIVKYISNHELTLDYIEEVLKLLIPNNNGEPLIKHRITKKGKATAIFYPKYECINVSLDKINNWLNINVKDFEEMFKIKDTNVLKSYLFLFLITHEIEHSYQYLIGKGIINIPSNMIQRGYEGIYNLFLKKESIIPRPIKEIREIISLILYKRNENFYLLERNANIESADLLCELAQFMEREDIFKTFNEMKNSFMIIGYTESSKGSLEETYQKILLYDRYRRFYEKTNMSEEEKARHGLNIEEQTRQRILEKKYKNS